MAVEVADHLLPGLRQSGDGQGVGRGAGRDEPHAGDLCEDPAKLTFGRGGVVVITVGRLVRTIGLMDGVQRLRAQPGVVVTEESGHLPQCTGRRPFVGPAWR